jgi:hypothetical protein
MNPETTEFKNYLRDTFPYIVKDIKKNEYKPETQQDLELLMYEYLGRYAYDQEIEIILKDIDGKWFTNQKS